MRRCSGLHVLADDDPRWPHPPIAVAHAACEGGASVVQLRAKHLTDRAALEQALEIRALTREAGVTFIVNDRFDLALLSEADGVHLGQDDLPPDRIPADARERLLIGRSPHEPSQWQAAAREPIDYVAFGPVFGTASKDSPYDARGLEALASAAGDVAPLPMIAIGGIDIASLPALREAGAAGFAVISAITTAQDPVAATRALADGFGAERETGAPA